MVIRTSISRAKAGTISLKTTIPEAIVEYMGLTENDELEWKMEVAGSKRIVVAEKISGTSKRKKG